MIYDIPNTFEPIRQGDIFIGLPRMEVSLNEIVVFDERGQRLTTWSDIAKKGQPVNIITSVRPVKAIVATQNCDAIRGRDLTLFEIREFKDVYKNCRETIAPRKWKDIITQHARLNLKWFYLPISKEIGFIEKMAVDFMVTIRVPRAELDELKSMRCCRLNKIAYEHFRERISEFYRRYPYDEWYSLDEVELESYRKDYPDVIPFEWQEVKKKIADSQEKTAGN
jgi:hypothetical protein